MLEVIQKIVVALFVVVAIYFGILWIIKTFEYASEIKAEDKVKGAKLSTKYLCVSAIGIFLAIEIYAPNVICIPSLFFFIGLFWLNYIIYKKTVIFLEKRGGERN